MNTRAVRGSAGGGKAGSQPKDLGGKAGANSGVWEHLGAHGDTNGGKGQKKTGLGAGRGVWAVGPRGSWTQTLGHNLGVCTQKCFSPNGWAELG